MDALVRRLRAAGCVFAEREAAILVEAAEGAALEAMVARRVAGEPLEYVVGWAEFAGLRIAVEPGVFVPRHKTELLAEEALNCTNAGAVVVELCCGTAAVGAYLTAHASVGELHAVDVDSVAVECARRNVPRAEVHEGDLYEPLPDGLKGRVGVLIANAPYVPSADVAYLPPEAREHEHRVALDGGEDGLTVLRRVIAEAPQWLQTGGTLLVEAGRTQATHVAAVMSAHDLAARVTTSDDATAVIGTKTPRGASKG